MLEESLLKLKTKLTSISSKLQTEESTKTALVLPFIQMLNYDIFDPDQVLPEYNCDIVKAKGEKVDYALLINNKIEIIIECKQLDADLNIHRNQLARYFVSTKANYGILTNGVIYKFYTDLDNTNLMDDLPFFQFSIADYTPDDVAILEQFCQDKFDSENIRNNAIETRLTTGILDEIKANFDNPSLELIKMFTKTVYKGRYTDNVIAKFQTLFKKSIKSYINEQSSSNITNIIESEKQNTKIVTTEDELQAYYIVKSIARKYLPSEDIVLRDQVSKCCVLYKNNNATPIIKFYFNNSKKLSIECFDREEPYKIEIDKIDDIFNYVTIIENTCQKYLTPDSKKRCRFKFSMINASPGEYVIFEPTKLQCIIVDDSTISYNDEEYSLSGFCKEFLPDNMRNAAEAYQGPKYFSYNGQLLTDLRDQSSN